MGGYHPNALDRAATFIDRGLADAWLPGTQPDIEGLTDRKETYDGMLAERSIDPETVTQPIFRDGIVARTTEEAEDIALEHIWPSYEEQYGSHEGAEESDQGDLGADIVGSGEDPMELVRERAIVGDPDTWIEQLRTYEDATGADHVIVRLFFPGMSHERMMEQLAVLCDDRNRHRLRARQREQFVLQFDRRLWLLCAVDAVEHRHHDAQRSDTNSDCNDESDRQPLDCTVVAHERRAHTPAGRPILLVSSHGDDGCVEPVGCGRRRIEAVTAEDDRRSEVSESGDCKPRGDRVGVEWLFSSLVAGNRPERVGKRVADLVDEVGANRPFEVRHAVLQPEAFVASVAVVARSLTGVSEVLSCRYASGFALGEARDCIGEFFGSGTGVESVFAAGLQATPRRRHLLAQLLGLCGRLGHLAAALCSLCGMLPGDGEVRE
jgi:hypothetical protein